MVSYIVETVKKRKEKIFMEDHEILDMYFERNEDAIKYTAEKYGRYCMSVSMNILDNEQDAEECVSDTYLQTWRSIPPARPNCLRLFLATIVRRLSLNRWRNNTAQRRDQQMTIALEELEECIPSRDEDDGRLGMLINGFLGTLSATDRIIFLQRYWYTLSAEEIGREVGMSRSAVWTRLHRLREKLRVYLTERGYGI